jgi:hypothetical protein
MTALATIVPSKSFRVEAFGKAFPVGKTVISPKIPGGTTVTLKEYAWAVAGIVHVLLDWMGNVRMEPPVRLGGPKAPMKPTPERVSTTRQGVMATKTKVVTAADWSEGLRVASG